MPQMGEFSLAIGHLSVTNAAVGPVVAPVLAIATAITAILAPLTSKIATPVYDWVERRSPPAVLAVNLVIYLGVQSFWAAFSLPGETGRLLKQSGRRIIIDACIIAVLTAIGTAAVYTLPDLFTEPESASHALLGVILGGATVGINLPAAIAIWRELRVVASLTVGVTVRETAGEPARYTLRTLVRDGMATAFLLVAVLLMTPLIIQLFALGSLSAPLSVFLLVASAGALVFAGFHVHRVLRPVFRNTFIAPAPRSSDAAGIEPFDAIDVESPALNHWADPASQPAQRAHAGTATPVADDSTEDLWRFLEERIELFSPHPAAESETAERTAQREAD
jgi:hypothetical protein